MTDTPTPARRVSMTVTGYEEQARVADVVDAIRAAGGAL